MREMKGWALLIIHMALTSLFGGSVRKDMNTDEVFLRGIPAETALIAQAQKCWQGLMILKRKLHGSPKTGIIKETVSSDRKIFSLIPIGKYGGYAEMDITGEHQSMQDRKGQDVRTVMDYCRENHISSADGWQIMERRSYAKDTRSHLNSGTTTE